MQDNNLRIGNKQLIKDINRSLVIEKIRYEGPISRTDISKSLQLGLSTVTNIIEELKNEDLVFENGEADSTGGRRPILLEFNYEFGYTLGIKIEENQLIIALTNLKADIMDKKVIPFKRNIKSSVVIPQLINGIKEVLSNNPFVHKCLLGVGIAVSGLVNYQDGTLIRSSLLGWEQVNLKQQLENEFLVPVFIDNDINAYTLAELTLGFGNVHDNFICISVGAGVGASIVINRSLYYGDIGGAGEIGHSIIQVNGFHCHCGQKGCLEMYASDKFFENYGPALVEEFQDSLLRGSSFTSDEVYQAAQEGDELAKELLKQSGEYLGIGLVNLINILNPSIIILVGERMSAKDFFLSHTLKVSGQNFFTPASYQTKIIVSDLGNDAWVKGASLLAINHLFRSPIYKDSLPNLLGSTIS